MSAYEVTSDHSRLDVKAIHAYLTQSYWAKGIPLVTVERAVMNSVCFGVLHSSGQVGFARVITDKTTFAYLADVYVLEHHRGKGLSRRLMEAVKGHPDLQGLRRILLATRDAHGLYEKFGFKPLGAPERMMEIQVPNLYAEN